MVVTIIGWGLIVLVISSILYGFQGVDEFEFYFGFKDMSSPYYDVGIMFNDVSTENVEIKDLQLAFFFFVVGVTFYRLKNKE